MLIIIPITVIIINTDDINKMIVRIGPYTKIGHKPEMCVCVCVCVSVCVCG